MLDFLSVWKTRRRYVNSGRLLADHILQHIGSERSDSIREMHFWTFFCFFAFSNLRKVRGFQNIFPTSRAQRHWYFQSANRHNEYEYHSR
mgnify:CR=1 FL=1